MGRPPTPLLSTDRITAAAMDLVAATGGFTMPELARKLQVSPSSLYNHVTGRDQIVELLRERAMSEVQLPAEQPERPWTEVVADVLRSYRRSYARYPRLIPLLTAYPVNSSHAIRMYNVLAATLRAGRVRRRRHAAGDHADGLFRAGLGPRRGRPRRAVAPRRAIPCLTWSF